MPAKKKSQIPVSKAPALKISPARQVAFHLLRELATSTHTHSDELLMGPKVEALSPQDRNLCTTLVMGVLRWQLALDVEIANFLTHKTKMDEPVKIALRLGVFQLSLLDRIPAHAAISDSVELTKRAGHKFASGLVNAVLRKAVPEEASIRERMRSEVAHPAWLVERWKKNLGEADAAAICDYDQQQPQTVVRFVSDDGEKQQLEPGVFLRAARRVQSSAEEMLKDDFRWQDEGSQLVAELLGGGAGEVKSILDCCAAPGGKTAILAERYPAARVVAADVSASRLAKMQERFASSPALAHIVYKVADAAEMPIEDLYDLILCDVPCSGTGTLARNPEIKLRLHVDEFARQQERQVAILSAALRHLAPGGRLVYSTCSLEPEEGQAVIARVLESSTGTKVISIAERLDEMAADGSLLANGAEHLRQHAVRGDFLRTIPGVSPCDGFFAALLTRA